MRSTTILDTKAFDSRAREALVLSLFEGLKNGESFQILTSPGDDELCKRLDALSVANLKWEYLEKSPQEQRLRIEKLNEKDAQMRKAGGCCGCCGG